jgi:UDP-N-acetylmuramate--alanine ligase
MKILDKKKHVFFSGIGGVGMSGIAELLLHYGFRVSGSDRESSVITDYLISRGATISIGHNALHLKNVDVLVYSSAIPEDNPERLEAKRLKIPQIRRAEMLAELMHNKCGIGIAGTHGKTTTTAMCGEIFRHAGLDPTVVVGGRYMQHLTNAIPGNGKYFITEADEYDKSFLVLNPTFAVITSVEADHLECYGSYDHLKDSFTEFANKVPAQGTIIFCQDDPVLKSLSDGFLASKISYGIETSSDYQAHNITLNETTSRFDVHAKGKNLGEITLNVPGEHNVKNALAVIALSQIVDIPFEPIRRGFSLFKGVERRFQIKADVDDVLIIDDYAHHPSEIKATLSAAKKGWNRRIIAIFQPHLYTRTRDFYVEFAQALSIADVILLTDIYPAREKKIPGVTGEIIFEEIKKIHNTEVYFIADKAQLPHQVLSLCKTGDMIITLGAGDIWRIGEMIISLMKKQNS